jgi:hypothetical protein
MTVIYGLVFMTGLLTGGLWGWLTTSQHYERVEEEHDLDELEMARFQELYTAWAILHRIRERSSGYRRNR